MSEKAPPPSGTQGPPPAYQGQPPQMDKPSKQPQAASYPTAEKQPPPAYPGQQQQPVAVFDQGARFDPNKPPTVPPPPPGVAPTEAQVAASQGQGVTMTQERRDVWGGGSDGGHRII